jgi:zinc transport system permease protein
VSVVLAELAVLLGIGVAYYGEATAGGVIVLVAVAIYVLAVGAGKVKESMEPDETPELGAVGTDGGTDQQ